MRLLTLALLLTFFVIVLFFTIKLEVLPHREGNEELKLFLHPGYGQHASLIDKLYLDTNLKSIIASIPGINLVQRRELSDYEIKANLKLDHEGATRLALELFSGHLFRPMASMDFPHLYQVAGFRKRLYQFFYQALSPKHVFISNITPGVKTSGISVSYLKQIINHFLNNSQLVVVAADNTEMHHYSLSINYDLKLNENFEELKIANANIFDTMGKILKCPANSQKCLDAEGDTDYDVGCELASRILSALFERTIRASEIIFTERGKSVEKGDMPSYLEKTTIIRNGAAVKNLAKRAGVFVTSPFDHVDVFYEGREYPVEYDDQNQCKLIIALDK